MRVIAFSLVLGLSVASADVHLKREALDAEEKAKLVRHALETCDRTPVEVYGSSYEAPEGDAWEAYAFVYMAPYKSDAGLCKSRVCGYTARKPKAKKGRMAGEFNWGRPSAIGGFSVWLSENSECLGNPSSKIELPNPIEENTLRSLIDRSEALAADGKAWLRSNDPDGSRVPDGTVGELELISVEDDFGVLRYRLVYGGATGLQLLVGTRDGNFYVHEAGAPPRP